jgi:hypothetical protein
VGGSWISSAPLPCPSYAKIIPNRTPVDRNANFCADSPFYRTRKNSKTSHFWPLISDMNPKKLSQTVSFRRTFAINPAAIQSLIRWKTILKSSFVAGAPKDLILFTKDDQRIARTFQFVSKSESNPAETLLRVSDESRIWTGLRVVIGLTPDKGRETATFQRVSWMEVFSAGVVENTSKSQVDKFSRSVVSGRLRRR